MNRVANSVRSLLPAVWPFKAALRLLSRVVAIDLLPPLAECLHTITADNGKEFAAHQRIVQELGIDFLFAHLYAAWERGSNENMDGLLLQYFPNCRNFGFISEKEIDAVMYKLNHRPRKCLYFKSPFEIFFEHSVALVS
jgi:IS30 family transposase